MKRSKKVGNFSQHLPADKFMAKEELCLIKEAFLKKKAIKQIFLTLPYPESGPLANFITSNVA